MARILVWDLPVRVFHWLFSSAWIAALCIAFLVSKSSLWFPYHSLIGLVLGMIVVLRILWGFTGTRYARFGSFVFGPATLLRYLKSAVLWKDTRHPGHNPGAAYAIFAMIGLTVAQVATGILVGSGRRNLKEIHEILAWVMLGVIAVHLLGLAMHTFRHRELIGLSMLTGRKSGSPGEAIPSGRPLAAVVFLAVVGAWAFVIFRNYDPARQITRIPLIGTEIQIGEGDEIEL